MASNPSITPEPEMRAASGLRHIAIIMDGNGRWAMQRHLPRHAGHRAGVKAVRRTVETCAEIGVEVLTLFAFSSENWRRPSQEVGTLMELFMTALGSEAARLHKNNVRLAIIGDRSAFDAKLQARMRKVEELTADNNGLQLIVSANYGGRWDISQAARRLAQRVEEGELRAAEISPDHLHGEMSLAGLPEPDLFIRTGGEQRISNFLLWQLAYTELYFADVLWPDFDREHLEAALTAYANRQRRFGHTSEQVERLRNA
ncbi:MAG: di-trans,poly-cis-decaprenylcistransferase [Pseudomonadota bacterium]|nr:MAG: di-trans,poly-cis-decaprenylcistransferase [Pseudomonadota bacterium]